MTDNLRFFEFESWNPDIKMTMPWENVKKIKIRWLSYDTATTGNRYLKIKFKHLASAGIHELADGSNDDFFYMLPLNKLKDVNIYESNNGPSSWDYIFDNVKPQLRDFKLEFWINENPAYDITSLNKLSIMFEIA